MSNYYAYSRTNYFRVTDEEKYAELFSHLIGSEDSVEDFTEEKDGVKIHGFGCSSSIDFVVSAPDAEDPEYDFDFFLKELQKIIPKDEAFIFTEIGHEKLCYLTGYSIIVTKGKIEMIDLRSDSISKAREMLENDKFDTQLEY